MRKITTPEPAPAIASKAVFWAGNPQICDMCQRPLKDTFIDGATRPQNRWGVLDLECHRKFGVGLGTGKGQMYRRQDDGRWLKVEG